MCAVCDPNFDGAGEIIEADDALCEMGSGEIVEEGNHETDAA